jgi:uncharacterized protein YbaR (Trm112 family)
VFLPLVDILRCVQAHADTWLVASITRAEGREVITGTLGCPICMAEYPIRDGVVYFGEGIARAAACRPDEDEAVRLAAALDLTEPRVVAVLHGEWGAHAPILRGVSPAQLLLVNPPEGVTSGDGVSIVIAESAPFAYASVNAVAIGSGASDAMRGSLETILRGDGRMFGRIDTPIPPGFTELARDDEVWVAERPRAEVGTPPIMPTRRIRKDF